MKEEEKKIKRRFHFELLCHNVARRVHKAHTIHLKSTYIQNKLLITMLNYIAIYRLYIAEAIKALE